MTAEDARRVKLARDLEDGDLLDLDPAAPYITEDNKPCVGFSYVRVDKDGPGWADSAARPGDVVIYSAENLAAPIVLPGDTPLTLAPEDSPEDIPARLEYLRSQIQAECISYGEISELQGLAAHIDAGDVELLEWAGVPEDAPVIKGGALVSTTPRVPRSFPREYKGWIINARNTRGLYVATNYSAGYGRVMADTLQGIKHMITEAIAEGPKQ